MSLSPLVSFKSRFVTYLLNFSRISTIQKVYKLHCFRKTVVIDDSRAEFKQLGQKTNTKSNYKN